MFLEEVELRHQRNHGSDAHGHTTLKFFLQNGLQKSNDPAAFLGSQYAAPLMEANLPLSLDQLF